LSNSLISITNGGSGYNVQNTTVTISPPTGKNGEQAYATANVVGGVIDAIYITTPGAGYIQTPTITIVDANNTPGTGATAVIAGETSPRMIWSAFVAAFLPPVVRWLNPKDASFGRAK
jgi:hypothetical protein